MVAPLLIAAGVQAAGSLLGGLFGSSSANKAAKAEQQRQREAIAAQQAAAARVQGLQAPGVAAYQVGLNALTQRLGLPTQGVADAIAGPDEDAYLRAYPDVAADAEKIARERGDVNGDGSIDRRDGAAWHFANYGQGEGRTMPTRAPTQPSPTNGQTPTNGNALSPQASSYSAPAYAAPSEFSFSVDSFKDNPAYKFALEQGSGQVMASSAATGALNSGAALKALQDRGQKTAYGFYADERNAAYDRYNRDRAFGRDVYESDRNFGRGVFESDRNYQTGREDRQTDDLWRYLGVGQNALNATTNSIVGAGNATATGLEGIGNSQAANALAQGNIWGGVLGDLAGIAKGVLTKGNALDGFMRGAAAASPYLY